MKYAIACALAALTCLGVSAQNVFLVEQFDYPAGSQIRDFGWFAHSASSTNPQTVTEGGLAWSLTDYVGSGIGNAVAVNNTGSDENKPFSQSLTSGSVYVSFLMNVPEAVTTANQGYFLHVGEYSNPGTPVFTSLSSAFRARTFVVASDIPGKYKLGLTFNESTIPADSTGNTSEDLDLNVSYLVVVKYEIVPGDDNDQVSFYIFEDGDDISSEPAMPSVGPLGGTAVDLGQVQLVALRQYSADQNILVDGIVAQDSWQMLEVQEPVFDCPDLSANFGDACNAEGNPGELNENCECIELELVPLLIENFDYPADTLLRDFGWFAHSASTTNPLRVTNGGLSLTQTDYIASGIGNAAAVNNTGSDENRPFNQSVTTGSVYLSFLMNVPTEVTSAGSGYFLHLGEYSNPGSPNFTSISTSFRARTYVAPGSTPDKYRLGLTFNSATVPTAEADLSDELDINATYIVVVKYEFIEGTDNDVVSLYVFADGDDISIEPASASIGPVAGTAGDLAFVQLVALRQYSAEQNIIVDGIVAQQEWKLLAEPTFDCPSLSANIGDTCDANGAAGQINESCECEVLATCTAEGGTLEAPANRSFCVGTGSPVAINVTAVGASGDNQRWALVNSAGDIIEIRGNNSLFNLDAQAPGDYTIRYIRFNGTVANLSAITNISQVGILEGCFDLASNAITVFLREEPVAGTLTALTPTSFCANSGAESGIQVQISGNVGQNGRYGITSSSLGQQIVASNTTGTFNLNGFAPGNYIAAHISFQQGVNVASAQFPNQIQGCFDLSNFINFTILDCAEATLGSSPNPTSGTSFVTFNVPSEEFTTIEVYDMNGRKVSELFGQNVQSNVEYRLEFDGSALPNGVYLYRLTTESEVIINKFMIAR